MLVTNFNREQKYIYIETLKEYKKLTNDKNLFIDDNAYVRYNFTNVKDNEMCALRMKEYKDLTLFWKIFDKNENKNKGKIR